MVSDRNVLGINVGVEEGSTDGTTEEFVLGTDDGAYNSDELHPSGSTQG